jgi:hypothetical protein
VQDEKYEQLLLPEKKKSNCCHSCGNFVVVTAVETLLFVVTAVEQWMVFVRFALK